MSIAGGSDLGLFEINEAASLVQDAAHQDANIIFGTVIDDSLGDEVRLTVIAAGFDAGPGAARGGRRRGSTGGAHRIESAKAGKLTSTLFEPVDAVSVPVHTNGATRASAAMTTTSTCRRSCAAEFTGSSEMLGGRIRRRYWARERSHPAGDHHEGGWRLGAAIRHVQPR